MPASDNRQPDRQGEQGRATLGNMNHNTPRRPHARPSVNTNIQNFQGRQAQTEDDNARQPPRAVQPHAARRGPPVIAESNIFRDHGDNRMSMRRPGDREIENKDLESDDKTSEADSSGGESDKADENEDEDDEDEYTAIFDISVPLDYFSDLSPEKLEEELKALRAYSQQILKQKGMRAYRGRDWTRSATEARREIKLGDVVLVLVVEYRADSNTPKDDVMGWWPYKSGIIVFKWRPSLVSGSDWAGFWLRGSAGFHNSQLAGATVTDGLGTRLKTKDFVQFLNVDTDSEVEENPNCFRTGPISFKPNGMYKFDETKRYLPVDQDFYHPHNIPCKKIGTLATADDFDTLRAIEAAAAAGLPAPPRPIVELFPDKVQQKVEEGHSTNTAIKEESSNAAELTTTTTADAVRSGITSDPTEQPVDIATTATAQMASVTDDGDPTQQNTQEKLRQPPTDVNPRAQVESKAQTMYKDVMGDAMTSDYVYKKPKRGRKDAMDFWEEDEEPPAKRTKPMGPSTLAVGPMARLEMEQKSKADMEGDEDKENCMETVEEEDEDVDE